MTSRRPCWCSKAILWELTSFLMQKLPFVPVNLHRCCPRKWKRSIVCFHMTSWRPYLCPKTMKRWPCLCPKLVLGELNSFLMQTLSFVPVNLRRCCPREWKRFTGHFLVALSLCFKARLSAKPVYEYKNNFYLKGFAVSLFSTSDTEKTLAVAVLTKINNSTAVLIP